ncbi:HPF/RaiA family ribosome-associated protein [Falsiroseomonas ponticola]|uniref:HPF/RaiA family ribosome-associated protein n=1 Tax=Falsiroseomonas ponticola TaxID=2786951 RepID=UPI001933C9FD|nr:HPF/RaiA family ribosome-associated protein [Roseomonas ponticola]
MLVQVNTDNDTNGSAALVERVQEKVEGQLGRFAQHLTRVEVHINDVNAEKGGTDKRCMIEARPANARPMAVTHEADTVKQALVGALQKASRQLDTTLGRRMDHKGAESIRTADPG